MIHRFFLCLLFVMSFLLPGNSQEKGIAPLNGVVTVLNSKTKTGKTQYVRTAQVVASQANPSLTDNEGRFKLTFIDSEPGVEVELAIEKEGLEVVNKDALRAVLRKDPGSLLKIYMCNPEQLAASVLHYRGVAEKFIVAKYKAKILQLQKENKAKAAVILELEDQKSAALRQFQEIATRLAAVNLDEVSSTYKQALELFQSGRLEEALKFIEKADLDNQMELALAQREAGRQVMAQSQTRIEEISSAYMLQARLQVANLSLKLAEVNYRKAIAARDSSYVPDNLEFARLLIAQNLGWKAIPLLQHTLKICEQDKHYSAYTHLLLGTALLNQVEVAPAILQLTDAVVQYGDLAETDIMRYGPNAGVAILSCAAAHFFNSNQPGGAEIGGYGKEIFGILMQTDSARYMPFYAWALYADAALSMSADNMDEVLAYYTYLAENESPQYRIFLGTSKMLKAAFLRDSLDRLSDRPELGTGMLEEINHLYAEGLSLLMERLAAVERSYGNIGFMVNGPDELPDFESLMEESDYPIGVLFSGFQMWWLGQTLNGSQNEGSTSEEVLKLLVEKSRMLAEQNHDRYLPHYAQYTAFLGFNYALSDKHRLAFPLLKDGLRMVDDPGFKKNPAQPFLHSLLEAQLGIAQTLCYVSEGAFCETSKEELLSLYTRVDSLLKAYHQIPMMEQALDFIRLFDRGLRKCTNALSFRKYVSYQENLRQFKLAAQQQNAQQAELFYAQAMTNLEAFLEEQFEIEDALILETMYADWRNAYWAEQPDSLLLAFPKELALQYQILEASPAPDPALRERMANNCGNWAWIALQKGQYRLAMDMANNAYLLDPPQSWVLGNKAHSFLLGGQWKRALRIYQEWGNRSFSLDGTIQAKTAFLADLSQLSSLGVNLPDIAQTQSILEGKMPAPELLLRGLNILEEGHQRWDKGMATRANQQTAKASLEAARQWYEQLIRPPYLSAGFFDDDLSEIWYRLEAIAAFQGKKLPPIPFDWSAAQLDVMAQKLVQDAEMTLIGIKGDTLAQWTARLDAAVRLAEAAKSRQAGNMDYATGAALAYAQCAYAHLLMGEKEKALTLVYQALDLEPQLAEVALSAIPVLYLNKKTEEAKSLFLKNRYQNKTLFGTGHNVAELLPGRFRSLEKMGLLASGTAIWEDFNK